MTDDDLLPKVTPYLLRRMHDMCPRRLELEHRGELGNRDPVNRSRLRGAFLDAVRTAHSLEVPLARAPWRFLSTLEPEEQAALEQAAHWYVHLFGDREVTVAELDLDRPTEVPGLGVRIGGWVDLTVVDGSGHRELRQLDVWGGAVPDDLGADWGTRLALLRLEDWVGHEPLRVSRTDLLHGVRREIVVDPDDAIAEARAELAAALDDLTARADERVVEHGRDCPTCKFHKNCPEFPHAVRSGGALRKDSLLPGVLSITPSSVEAWHRCRRAWFLQYVLNVPASDDSAPGVHGQQVHDLLRLLHREGPCDDPTRIDDIVAAHGASERVRAELVDHSRRCPRNATSFGHEFTRARLTTGYASFVASARIDAAWVHDGILDVRDYKTGGLWYSRVADDPRARLQAWVMAPIAATRGLQLRVRYEHLATEIVDDPDPWEPDADDIDAIGRELVDLVTEIRQAKEWRGVADRDTCGTCRYRSVCRDSAAPAAPTWPRVDDDPDAPELD